MTKAFRYRRGTTGEHVTFIGLEGEITVNTEKKVAVVHDGNKQGGYELVGVAATQTLTNKNIIANEVVVSGAITATSFVGDGSLLTNLIGIGAGVDVKSNKNFVGTATTIDFESDFTVNLSPGVGVATIFLPDNLNVSNLNASGISTLSNVIIGSGSTELIITGDVNISNNLISNSLEVTNTSSQVINANEISTNQIFATEAFVDTLDVGGGINPGTDVFVSGDVSVSDTLYVGPNSPIDEETRFFVSNLSGEVEFTVPGTYIWTAPVGITSVSVVCVGGGGGGVYSQGVASGAGGGGLAWKNNIPVTPGQSYTVVVGSGGQISGTFNSISVVRSGTGGISYFESTEIVSAYGGQGAVTNSTNAGVGGTYFGDGGGNGGQGGSTFAGSIYIMGGSGGAGGYVGAGGSGGTATSTSTGTSGFSGSGGGAGGGGSSGNGLQSGSRSGPGGGVGLYGQGSDGAGGGAGSVLAAGGRGGSGGSPGGTVIYIGGLYGGGGGCVGFGTTVGAGVGAGGAVRLVWSTDKSVLFPTTNVQKSSPTDVFVYKTTGNVGLGTTNPSSKLEVIGGDIKVGLNTSTGLILTASNGSKYRIFVNTNGTLSTVLVT
jgi:hypothetical protein